MLLAWSEVSPRDCIESIFDRVAWVTRYSKGAVSLRDAMGILPDARVDAWTVRQYEVALARLLQREQAEADRARSEEAAS